VQKAIHHGVHCSRQNTGRLFQKLWAEKAARGEYMVKKKKERKHLAPFDQAKTFSKAPTSFSLREGQRCSFVIEASRLQTVVWF